eukprot:2862559-Pyramimonas_sp.AAC.1
MRVPCSIIKLRFTLYGQRADGSKTSRTNDRSHQEPSRSTSGAIEKYASIRYPLDSNRPNWKRIRLHSISRSFRY